MKLRRGDYSVTNLEGRYMLRLLPKRNCEKEMMLVYCGNMSGAVGIGLWYVDGYISIGERGRFPISPYLDGS